MDYKVIENLLDKYFEGETTLREEARLREFFLREDVPSALQPYQPLFRHFSEERETRLDDSFDEKLLAQLEEKPEAKTVSLRFWALRIAAAVILGLGLWWAYFPAPQDEPQQAAAIDWSKYEVTDPKDAFKLTSTALLKASSELNRGASTAAHEMNNLKEVGRYFKKK